MNKFKVGDKVVGVELEDKYGTLALHGWLVQNKVYTVSDVERSLVFIRTALNEPLGWWAGEWFKLADEQILENAFNKAIETVGANVVANSLIEKENKEMTAEQIREEILRIDSRIEEAKKDIENAEKERNSLVEKLREKGFEIVKASPNHAQRPVIGDRAEIVGNTSGHYFRLGQIVKVSAVCDGYYECVEADVDSWGVNDRDLVKI